MRDEIAELRSCMLSAAEAAEQSGLQDLADSLRAAAGEAAK